MKEKEEDDLERGTAGHTSGALPHDASPDNPLLHVLEDCAPVLGHVRRESLSAHTSPTMLPHELGTEKMELLFRRFFFGHLAGHTCLSRVLPTHELHWHGALCHGIIQHPTCGPSHCPPPTL